MKILVTGGCGFIGSALVRHVIRNSSHELVNVDSLTYAASPEALEDCAESSRYTHIEASITSAEALLEVFSVHDPDGVIHLAAESHVDRSIDGPEAFIQTNIVGTYRLLQAALQHFRGLSEARQDAFRFHHVSTDEVYGSLGEEGSFSEESPYQPNSPYSSSKAASDHLVRAWQETYGLPILLTNCSNNYGPYQFPEKLIPTIVLNAMAGKPLPIYGDGQNIRDWLHVDDHVDALLTIFEQANPGEQFNIGSENEWDNLRLVRKICTIMDELRPGMIAGGHASLIEFVTDRSGHDRRYAIDPTRIKTRLGWSPSVSFERGLRDTVAWYLENEAWWKQIQARGFTSERQGLVENKGRA